MVRFNHWAVIASVVLMQGLGWLWYDVLFSSAWMAAVGKTMADMKPAPSMFITSIAGSFVYCYTLAWLMESTGRTSLQRAVALACALWLGIQLFDVATHYGFLMYPPSLVAIDSGEQLVAAIIAAVVLGGWRRK